jgi:hypothetical protein
MNADFTEQMADSERLTKVASGSDGGISRRNGATGRRSH